MFFLLWIPAFAGMIPARRDFATFSAVALGCASLFMVVEWGFAAEPRWIQGMVAVGVIGSDLFY